MLILVKPLEQSPKTGANLLSFVIQFYHPCHVGRLFRFSL